MSAATAIRTHTGAQRRVGINRSEAKRPETRAERLKTTLAWVKEAKQRHWKYA